MLLSVMNVNERSVSWRRIMSIEYDLLIKEYKNDSSEKIWKEYYEPFYSKIDWEFWKIFDYKKLVQKKERYYAECREITAEFGKSFIGCKLGGELDFNFNLSKYKRYENILNKDNKVNKANAIKLLEECAKNQYRYYNFSVLITTGGLNNVKGTLSQERGKRSLDRFDVFVFVLNDYFNNRKIKEDYMHIIFSESWRSAKENRECLYVYLSLFENIEDYFKKNYNIIAEEDQNKKLIEDLINSGSKPIDSGERVVEYLMLAKRYWKAKENGIKKLWQN